MGCEVVVVGGSVDARRAIEQLFEQRDSVFSRFRSGSELERVNAMNGAIVPVSPVFAAAIKAALDAARATDGLVDPTLGAALEAAGYDEDFDRLVPDPRPIEPVSHVDWRQIHLRGRVLLRPPGTALDLNGVVKAMTVDEAAGLLDGPGFVSAGGDIATRESSIVVSLPGGGVVTLASGGIATSGCATRRWLRGGRLQHHLIDPSTGLPSTSPWLYVTAVGRDCLSADVAAKAGYLAADEGPRRLDERGVAARFVSGDGVIVENGCWARSMEYSWA